MPGVVFLIQRASLFHDRCCLSEPEVLLVSCLSDPEGLSVKDIHIHSFPNLNTFTKNNKSNKTSEFILLLFKNACANIELAKSCCCVGMCVQACVCASMYMCKHHLHVQACVSASMCECKHVLYVTRQCGCVLSQLTCSNLLQTLICDFMYRFYSFLDEGVTPQVNPL